MTDEPKARIGRPKSDQKPWKNITVDADLLQILQAVQQKYSEEIGIPLTLSQTLRLLIKRAADVK